MIARVLLLVATAGGLIVFGSIAWMQAHPAAAVPTPPPTISILVASHPIDAGSLLKPDDLASLAVPVPEAAAAIADTPVHRSDLRGSMVRRSLVGSERLTSANVIRPGEHGFLAAVLDPGMQAMTIGLDRISSDISLIWPGDRVDVLLVRDDTRGQRSEAFSVSSETVLTDVRVIAIDQKLMRGVMPGAPTEPAARTITLEVSSDDAPRLAVAIRLGKLSFSVRSIARTAPLAGPAGQRIVWAGDVSRAGYVARPSGAAKPAHVESVVRIMRGAQINMERF